MSNDNQPNEMNSMDIYEVMKHLPHRYPFLLIDRVLDYTAGEKLTAIKNVTVNEPFFPGHFPHRPVFPGVLMLEALAQATGILAFKTTEDLPSDDSLYYFVGIDSARFKKPHAPLPPSAGRPSPPNGTVIRSSPRRACARPRPSA